MRTLIVFTLLAHACFAGDDGGKTPAHSKEGGVQGDHKRAKRLPKETSEPPRSPQIEMAETRSSEPPHNAAHHAFFRYAPLGIFGQPANVLSQSMGAPMVLEAIKKDPESSPGEMSPVSDSAEEFFGNPATAEKIGAATERKPKRKPKLPPLSGLSGDFCDNPSPMGGSSEDSPPPIVPPSKMKKKRSFSEIDADVKNKKLKDAKLVSYDSVNSLVTQELLAAQPELTREKYFGLNGVLKSKLDEVAQKISTSFRPLMERASSPRAFICYAWKSDALKNKEWQGETIQPLRNFLRLGGIEATMDIIDNDQGGIRSYRETIESSVDHVVAVVDKHFLQTALAWKKWRNGLEVESQGLCDGTTGAQLSQDHIDDRLEKERNLWKELESIQSRIDHLKKAGRAYQFVFPLLAEGVTHADVLKIWEDDFIALEYLTAEQQYEAAPDLAVRLFKEYFKNVKGLDKSVDYQLACKACKAEVRTFVRRKRSFLGRGGKPHLEREASSDRLAYLANALSSDFFQRYEVTIEGGLEPLHGYNLRRMLSSEPVSCGFQEEITSSQEDFLRSPLGDEMEEEKDLMALYQTLLTKSFEDLMKSYSPDNSQEEIGVFHLAVGCGFDKTYKATVSGLKKRKDLMDDVALTTGEYAFKAYYKAYQLLNGRKGCELFAAYAAFGCGHMTLTSRTYAGIGIGFKELFSAAKRCFEKSLSIAPELFINHFYLARIHMFNKNYDNANTEITDFLKQVRKYRELVKEEVDGDDGATPLAVQPVFKESDVLRRQVLDSMKFLKKIQAPGERAHEIKEEFQDIFLSFA